MENAGMSKCQDDYMSLYMCVQKHIYAYKHKLRYVLVTVIVNQRRQSVRRASERVFSTKGTSELRFTELPVLPAAYGQQSPSTDSCGNVSTNQSLELLLA